MNFLNGTKNVAILQVKPPPPIIVANSLLWYDITDQTTLKNSSNNTITGTNGENVASVKNKSPLYANTYDLTEFGTNVNKYNTSLTKPCILTDFVYNTGFKTIGSPPIPNGFTAFMVYKSTGKSGIQNLYPAPNNSLVTQYGLFAKSTPHTTDSPDSYPYPVSISDTVSFIGFGSTSTYYNINHYNIRTETSTINIFCSTFNKTTNTFTIYKNGTQNASGITTSNMYQDNTTSPLYIANRPDYYTASSLYLCEFLMYDKSLNDASRIYMEGYLASKWGIQSLLPAGHTYKSSTPPLTPLTYVAT